MTSEDIIRQIGTVKVVAILRRVPGDRVEKVARAVAAGGLTVMEVTMDSEDAIDMIRTVRRSLEGQVVVGAGTVLDESSARAALLAGAEFIVAPNLNMDVVRAALRYGKVVIPGAMTPTEIVAAAEAGAQLVKVFPAGVLGPEYIAQVHAPLRHTRLVPTGGVNVSNARAFIEAGAFAVGIGGSLVDRTAVSQGRYEAIEEAARAIVRAVGGLGG